MRDHHTLQNLLVNLADTGTKDLPFRVVPTGDMFQQKISKIFKYLPNIFIIAYDILALGYDSDGKDHNEMLKQVLQICRHVNLKFNKDKCHSSAHQSHSLVR